MWRFVNSAGDWCKSRGPGLSSGSGARKKIVSNRDMKRDGPAGYGNLKILVRERLGNFLEKEGDHESCLF